MRMWMVDPALMCRKHLLGEHLECHMFAGAIRQGKALDGYVENGLLQARDLAARHDALVAELKARSYNHWTPLAQPNISRFLEHSRVDAGASKAELQKRCPECAALQKGGEKSQSPESLVSAAN